MFSLARQLLTARCASSPQEPSSGRTALHLAVEEQDAEMVSLLVRCGADPNVLMYNDSAPYHLTLGRSNLRIQDELINVTDPSIRILYEDNQMWDAESSDWEVSELEENYLTMKCLKTKL